MIEFKYSLHGGLPDGLTLENIKQGMVAKRNKITVEILDKLDAIENYASGVRRIFKDYIGFDKQPEYSISDNGIIVTLYNMNYNEKENDGINEPQNEVINDGINDGKKLNSIERKNIILKLIEENENISAKKMIEKINVSRPTVERDLKELKEENKIEYIGSRKSGKWIIHTQKENDGINDGINVGKKMNITERRNIILKLIKENEKISAKQMIEKINVSRPTVERDLKELKEENKIEYIGSRKSGKWIIHTQKENDGINDGINVGKKMNITERRNIILKLIKENEKISAKQMIEKINVSRPTIERDLKELKEENKIEYVGSRKSGKWIIKE